jgi:hypothetical protein
MIHGSRSGLLDLVLRRYTFLEGNIHGSAYGLLDPVLRRYTFLEGKAGVLISVPKWCLAVEGGSEF